MDARQNADTRLPEGERVDLGGLVLCETFTPSTVSTLESVLAKWPGNRSRSREELLEALEQARTGTRAGFVSLGVVRRTGQSTFGGMTRDSTLPGSVEAAWLQLHFVVPSVSVVVVVFTFTEDASDLSLLLRQDYRTHMPDPHLSVYGRFAWLRSRNPWSRPKSFGHGGAMVTAEQAKARACEELMALRESECRDWLRSKLPGRFAKASPTVQPAARLMFTQVTVPFSDRSGWSRVCGLAAGIDIFRCEAPGGWALRDSRWRVSGRPSLLVVAARRVDVAKNVGPGQRGDSNWHLTQGFQFEQSDLLALHALESLLVLYGTELAKLRDGISRRPQRRAPVREARQLDAFLTGDGLDAATIAPDVSTLTHDLARFRWDVPEYIEDRVSLPGLPQTGEATNHLLALHVSLQSRAQRL